MKSDVEGIKERVLSLRTVPLRYEIHSLLMNRCSTWQNASLKERGDEEYPWRKPFPTEEFEVESKPLPVGPITLWQAAMITKYDLMMIEFSRDEPSWTIITANANIIRFRECSLLRET